MSLKTIMLHRCSIVLTYLISGIGLCNKSPGYVSFATGKLSNHSDPGSIWECQAPVAILLLLGFYLSHKTYAPVIKSEGSIMTIMSLTVSLTFSAMVLSTATLNPSRFSTSPIFDLVKVLSGGYIDTIDLKVLCE